MQTLLCSWIISIMDQDQAETLDLELIKIDRDLLLLVLVCIQNCSIILKYGELLFC